MATTVESEGTAAGSSTAVAYSEIRSIAVTITITPPILPPGYCPTSWQDLVNNAFAFELNLPAGYTQIIVSDTTPGPDDRDKIWFKIDADGRIIGIFSWSNTFSDWLEYNPKYIFHAVNGTTATDNADVLTTLNGTQPLSAGQWFYWKHAITNTGAVTATINGSAGIPVVKPDASAFIAGELTADWAIFAFYDGTNLRVISPWVLPPPPTPPTPVPPNIISPMLTLPAEYFILAGGGTTLDPDVTWPHGLASRPSAVVAAFVCYAAVTEDRLAVPLVAAQQSVVGTSVPIDSIICIRTDPPAETVVHPYYIHWDDTNVYFKYKGVDTDAGSLVGAPTDGIYGHSGPYIGGTVAGGGDTTIPDHWNLQFSLFPT